MYFYLSNTNLLSKFGCHNFEKNGVKKDFEDFHYIVASASDLISGSYHAKVSTFSCKMHFVSFRNNFSGYSNFQNSSFHVIHKKGILFHLNIVLCEKKKR